MKKSNPNISTIDEGQGLGVLKFGLDRKAVELILGKPDEIENYSYQSDEEDLTENWHYDELELSLGFDEEEDWRLTTIAITSSNYKFKELDVIGVSKAEFIEKLKDNKINDLEHEDWSTEESPSHELLSSDKLGINFWFDENKLSEVQWGPLFIDDETIDWPI
jgi:hypothetical protein